MHTYTGSGPYCYANSLSMILGPAAPPPPVIEVLTGSPFGFELIGGRRPLFDPYGWDPDRGLDDAIGQLGFAFRRTGADDDEQALAMLRDAVRAGPALAGPLELGLLRHQPGMTGPIGADHFVVVLEADEATVLFHDPQGHPYATLPTPQFLAAWRADTIAYRSKPYSLRYGFEGPLYAIGARQALGSAIPRAIAWLQGRTDLEVPPGTLGNADGVLRLAEMVADGSADNDFLANFAVQVGARRLADAATALDLLGLGRAAEVATRQARLVGSLQYAVVAGETGAACETLRRLAPTYEELTKRLTG
ncbi:hypothetical protein ACIA5D_22050 [Actinoplanes sp. NPDC051513]|uniref:hypothetical protein n=1 Tax=Actinoplanes sp. NPDC051513 TaxID=3363908 RepID=UPI0037BC648D